MLEAPIESSGITLRPTRNVLQARVRESASGYLRCSHCDANFTNPNDLKVHLLSEHSHISYSGADLPEPKAKRRRQRNQGLPALCPECSEQFDTLQMLVRHFARKHMLGEKPYECQKCRVGFSTGTDRQQHQRLCLAGTDADKIIRCRACGMGLTSARQWKVHGRLTNHKQFELVPKGGAVAASAHVLAHSLAGPAEASTEIDVEARGNAGGASSYETGIVLHGHHFELPPQVAGGLDSEVVEGVDQEEVEEAELVSVQYVSSSPT